MDIEVIKAKIAEFKAKGCEVPDMDMIKTPEQIEGIRAAAKINNACLDLIAQKIKAGMTTEEIDALAYDFITKSGRKTPYFINTGNYRLPASVFTAFRKASALRLMTRFATVFPIKRCLKAATLLTLT